MKTFAPLCITCWLFACSPLAFAATAEESCESWAVEEEILPSDHADYLADCIEEMNSAETQELETTFTNDEPLAEAADDASSATEADISIDDSYSDDSY